MGKFSIILPVRNGAAYVKECVNSILSQTNNDFNLLVLDNNSNDGTLQWLQSLSDPRIVIFPSATSLSMERNWGRIKTINKNEFITIIGHDDILLPDYLTEMNRLIEKHPQAGLYQAHFDFIDSAGKFIRHCLPMDEVQDAQEFLAFQFNRSMDSMGTGYMMRSKDYDALGGIPTHYPNLMFADYHLWVELTMISYKATTPGIWFNYRIQDTNVSKLTNGEQYQLAFEKYVRFLIKLRNENEKIRKVIDQYGRDWLMFFCESLSHRILKTPFKLRKISVREFVEKCKGLAETFIPGQSFEPLSKRRINIAEKLDRTNLGRSAFLLFKKISG